MKKNRVIQSPAPGDALLRWVGDVLEIQATREGEGKGRMVVRTNLGAVAIHREEVLRHVNEGAFAEQGDDWHDLPMDAVAPGAWRIRIPLLEVGVFEAKVGFLPDTRPEPEWPEGANLTIKVAPAHTAAGNLTYAAFVRQFGEHLHEPKASNPHHRAEASLDGAHYTVIPPSGTFRTLIRHLDHILCDLGFRNLLLLPVHPTPTTFARMGRFGSPFAGLDFLSIDPALAEFDTSATPLDQFRELVRAVHVRGGALFMDLPANHTGWAATFQTHHPEWYKRNADGSFHSPGAWGTTWEDLVELDYGQPALRRAIADVFLYWCRQGVDGFRCDAGYMIPKAAWDVIVALVRREFPETVFLLEGLGGAIETTAALIGSSGLDWAYSEVFQTYDRSAFEQMLPATFALSESRGPLVHFAETHDNNRLAATSPRYALLRIALSALLAQQGAFGITAGVEWFAKEKIDVHGCGGLNWGAEPNACSWLRRLTTLLRIHPLFGASTAQRMVQQGGGNVLAVLRSRTGEKPLLILANLDLHAEQVVAFAPEAFDYAEAVDLLNAEKLSVAPAGMRLEPGQVRCLSASPEDLTRLDEACQLPGAVPMDALRARQWRVMALQTRLWLGDQVAGDADWDALASRFARDPMAFSAELGGRGARLMRLTLPADLKREVPVPPGMLLLITSPTPFRAQVREGDGVTVRACGQSVALADGSHALVLPLRKVPDLPQSAPAQTEQLRLYAEIYDPQAQTCATGSVTLWALGGGEQAGLVKRRFSRAEVASLGSARALLTNGTGAMAQVRLKWGEIASQYDCLLALNRHPRVPDDRQVFFTRCLGWILCNGYSTPLSIDSLEHVDIAPDGSALEWRFIVPCGMGRRVPLTARMALEPGKNRVAIRFRREASASVRTPAVSVGLVLRPEIEWRNFHCKTKAYAGAEHLFPNVLADSADGFTFTPEPGAKLTLRMAGADWHRESVWRYNVAHPEEQARGQDGAGDLWSPGWLHIELAQGDEATLIAGEAPAPGEKPAFPALEAPLPAEPLPLLDAMRQAIKNYIVRRDAHKTAIAGYPWFLDWGRDTLIFLRGVAAAGDWDTVKDLLREFGRFEKGGTIPNMIRGENDANRETVDAPLWLAVAADDAISALGSKAVLSLQCGSRTLRDVLLSIATHYLHGTENGIHADPATGLIWSPAHYTWMDTNYPAGTPRMGYAVEVQALWVRLLDLLGREVSPEWARLASRVRRAFRQYFPLPEGGGLADCLCAEPGVSARDAVQDDAVRPNQLYAITLGLLADAPDLCASILDATECLLLPGAIRTLADKPVRHPAPVVRDGVLLNDPYHPYWGTYAGDEDTRRKPAYHNGTGWTFPFPLYAEALFLTYGEPAREVAKALLNSASILANRDCVTQLPECVQGDSPHAPCGTGAQAWGASELLRTLTLLHTPSTP